MSLDTLPSELLTQIFLHLPTISSVLSLSSTCTRFHSLLHTSQRLPILFSAAETEFGPLRDLIPLVTHNASQPAHLPRAPPPISIPLLQQIIHAGRVAQRYEELYPGKKWKSDYASRRLLTPHEKRRLRGAVYRVWLFGRAFHNPEKQTRGCRATTEARRERERLVGRWETGELAEMVDVWEGLLRVVVARGICPSNGKVRQMWRKRFPEGGGKGSLGCNIHLNYPPTSTTLSNWHFGPGMRESGSGLEGWGVEGWGDEITHYYVVEDMMKLDPEQLLFLRDKCPLKAQVEAYVRGLGEWFGNNGETFSEAVGAVIRQRGGDMQTLRMEVEMEELGIVAAGED